MAGFDIPLQLRKDKEELAKLEGELTAYAKIAAEIKQKEERARFLRGHITAAEMLINRQRDEQGGLFFGGGNGSSAPTAEPDAEDDRRVGTGLRDGIRAALRAEAPRGVKPRTVTRYLESQHFQPGGASDLSLRVSNEMWRMAKKNLLKKSKEGLYYLP
jgi:hypothetical protein